MLRQVSDDSLGDFLQQGLMNAQSVLVLDLEKCTRCDECTKACADTHDGVTRLIREGLRFDKFLVASSCRSCLDPYCMVGCPVNSIRRRGSREIIIEDWCIGCGKCAENCPYVRAPRPPGGGSFTAPGLDRRSFNFRRLLAGSDRPSMPAIYAAIAQDESRNNLIFDDVLKRWRRNVHRSCSPSAGIIWNICKAAFRASCAILW